MLLNSTDNSLLVKYVLFNGTSVDWWATPNADNSIWLSIGLHMMYAEFDPSVAIDFVITVRGAVDQLCPANVFMLSNDACEYAMNGRVEKFQCCPHSVTQLQPPYEQCCIDDIRQSPYE